MSIFKTEKVCTKCKIVKPYGCFTKDSRAKEGYSLYCKDCKKSYRPQKRLKKKIAKQQRMAAKRAELDMLNSLLPGHKKTLGERNIKSYDIKEVLKGIYE